MIDFGYWGILEGNAGVRSTIVLLINRDGVVVHCYFFVLNVFLFFRRMIAGSI